jgi:hypothetical protein
LREDGTLLRWTGMEAATVARMVALVLSAAGEGAMEIPEPEERKPARKVTEIDARLVRGEGGWWLSGERPDRNYDMPEFLPEEFGTVVTLPPHIHDTFGNTIFARGPRARVRVTVEVESD